MLNKFPFFFVLILLPLVAEPWGKDADLVRVTPSPACIAVAEPKCETPLLGIFAEIMIGFHQNVISPIQGPRSHYNPSSSHYTLQAMREYGFLQGFVFGCDRLMRENSDPWVYRSWTDPEGYSMKYDPIP